MVLVNLRKLCFSMILAAIALTGVGCSHHSSSASAKLPKTIPQRIVSISPNSTEILFALGLGERVVGVTSRCNYPPEASKKPKIGDMNASIERVIARKPDLVLASAVENDAAIRKLRNLGVRVLAIQPLSYDQVISSIETIGRETGAEKRASEITALMLSAKKAARIGSKSHPRVLVAAQSSPLWTAGPKTIIDDMIGYIGGENVGRDTAPGKFNQMPTEAAFAKNPDVIIVSISSDKEFFEHSSVWSGTNAVKNHRVYVIDPDLIFRPGPRLAKGLEEMARVVRSR